MTSEQEAGQAPEPSPRRAFARTPGHDAEAKAAVAALARDAGYDPVDAEPLWSAVNVEKVAGVMVTIAYVVGAGFDQALKIIRREGD